MKKVVLIVVILPLLIGGIVTMGYLITRAEKRERQKLVTATWFVTEHYNDFKLYPWPEPVTITRIAAIEKVNPREIQVIVGPENPYFATWRDLRVDQKIRIQLAPAVMYQGGGPDPYARGIIPKP